MQQVEVPKEKEHPFHEILISLDLGKKQDPTTYTVSEHRPTEELMASGKRLEVSYLSVDDIQPIPLRTDSTTLPEIIRHVFFDQRNWLVDPTSGKKIAPTLLVDEGGVGAPMTDTIVKSIGVSVVRYSLTAGTSRIHCVSRKRRVYTVPRTHLFNTLKTAVEFGRVSVDPRLRHAKTLVDEMKKLEFKESEETGVIRVVHRSGEHDDKSICTASSYWWASFLWRRPRRGLRVLSETETMRMMGYRPEFIQENRRLQLQRQAKRAGTSVGGPGLASNQGDDFTAAANPRVGKRL